MTIWHFMALGIVDLRDHRRRQYASFLSQDGCSSTGEPSHEALSSFLSTSTSAAAPRSRRVQAASSSSSFLALGGDERLPLRSDALLNLAEDQGSEVGFRPALRARLLGIAARVPDGSLVTFGPIQPEQVLAAEQTGRGHGPHLHHVAEDHHAYDHAAAAAAGYRGLVAVAIGTLCALNLVTIFRDYRRQRGQPRTVVLNEPGDGVVMMMGSTSDFGQGPVPQGVVLHHQQGRQRDPAQSSSSSPSPEVQFVPFQGRSFQIPGTPPSSDC